MGRRRDTFSRAGPSFLDATRGIEPNGAPARHGHTVLEELLQAEQSAFTLPHQAFDLLASVSTLGARLVKFTRNEL